MLAVQVIVSLDLYHINYMSIATIMCICTAGETKNFDSFLSLIVSYVRKLASTEEGGQTVGWCSSVSLELELELGGGVREVNYIYTIPCPTGPR